METATIGISESKGCWTIERDNEVWEIVRDEYTSDWCVIEMSTAFPQERYIKTRHGAFDYVFEQLGVIENGEWEIAPDRTSA